MRRCSDRLVRNPRKSEDCASTVSCWMVARLMRGLEAKKEAAWSPAFLIALAFRYLLEIEMISAKEVTSASDGKRWRRSANGVVSGFGGPNNDWIQSLVGGVALEGSVGDRAVSG